MDYLEGLLLGSQWCDTDYSNRRHFFSFFFFGIALCVMSALYIFTDQFASLLVGSFGQRMWLLVLLFLLNPFSCFRYYRFPVFVKGLILALCFLKYIVFVGVMTTFFLPDLKVRFDFEQTQVFVIDFVNQTLENSIRRFSSSSGSFSTILGVVAGGLYFVFLALLILLASIAVPGLMVIAFRLLQLGYDKLISLLVLKRYLDD